MISLTQISRDDIPWRIIETYENTNIFQTQHWFSFLEKSQSISPVVIEIKNGGEILGYICCGISSKYGLKIFGSPFRGWNSDFMGVCLKNDDLYYDVLRLLPNFVFNEMGCNYLEVIDPRISHDKLDGIPYRIETRPSFSFDLTQSEEDLFSKMDHDRQTNIRKSSKNGVVLEVAHDNDFAEDYYSQLKEVFQKQLLTPPFPLKRVQQLLDEFRSTKNILLLRARNADGVCIATYIDLAFNNTAVGWGAASKKEFQILRPNEACTWFCIKYWKSKGLKDYKIGGGWKNYKKSFGCDESKILRLMLSKNHIIDQMTHKIFMVNNSHIRNIMLKNL